MKIDNKMIYRLNRTKYMSINTGKEPEEATEEGIVGKE